MTCLLCLLAHCKHPEFLQQASAAQHNLVLPSHIGRMGELCMSDDPPSIYRFPSTPGIDDLGTHADAVCRAAEGPVLTDSRSVPIGAIIAMVSPCKLENEASTMLRQTVAKVLPEQFADCRARFSNLNPRQLLAMTAGKLRKEPNHEH
jgi:hypothetical protein